jgi:allophanate hydrolase
MQNRPQTRNGMTLDYSLDLASLASQYARGGLTPARVVRDVYAAIAAGGETPAWILLVPEETALSAAAALERARAAGAALPLYGVPFSVKDNIDVAGMATTAACPEFAYVPQVTAHCVRRLQEAGALLIGKTNLDQFATGLTGTRSPYGACVNPFDPRYIAGGSSSGSAVAVASGQVSFALGTDTAGSGRVPASLTNIVGLKPTRGLIGTSGMVPACRSLDCVSILALTCDDACMVFNTVRGYDADDPWSRVVPAIETPRAGLSPRFGVPRDPEFYGDAAARKHFERQLELIARTGALAVPLDYAPFTEAARMLYEGPWVAERLAAIKPFMDTHPDALLPVTHEIIASGAQYSAVDAFEATYRLQALKRRCDDALAGVDALLVPTTPTIYMLQEIAASPFELNRRLGYYTNFVNLLDYCALAVPAGLRRDGLPAGVTLVAPAFGESALLEYGARIHRAAGGRLGATQHPLPAAHAVATEAQNGVVLAVVGAHLSGLPLNHQLTGRGARLIGSALTAPAYRLYELPGANPRKPGLVRAGNGHGAAIEVELWELTPGEFGAFVAAIPAPLGVGSVALADGRQVKGFLCEHYAVSGARDISEFGGWRRFLAAGRKPP